MLHIYVDFTLLFVQIDIYLICFVAISHLLFKCVL